MTVELAGQHRAPLNIPDLDQGFRLKTRSMLALAVPMMYEQFTRHIDVAALRADGFGSLVTYAEFSRGTDPLAVGAPLCADVVMRHVELTPGRLGFECGYTFSSPPGTGDPSRYRETVSDTPRVCGRARLLLTLIRRDGKPGSRVVSSPLPQTRHLDVHTMEDPHPGAADLARPPDAGTQVAAGDRDGVFGPQHTDTNQVVFTGEYLSVLEDHVTWLLLGAGLPVASWAGERAAIVFRNPFRAGDRFTVRGRLWRDGARHVAVVGVHAAGAEQPGVVGRFYG